MRLEDVMSTQPVVVGPDATDEERRRLMDLGRVHHLPLVVDGRIGGMWLASDEGPVVLVGPERVIEAEPGSDALQAIRALVAGDGDAVVATDAGGPVGILTRADALRLVEEGLAAGGSRTPPPLVVRLIGPAGAGKTTLILRSLPMLRSGHVGVIQANPAPPHERLAEREDGATVRYAPGAHWRKGLREAITGFGGVDVLMVEDRDQPPRAGSGLGEDVQVIVVPAAAAGEVDERSACDAQAVVITRPRETAPDAVAEAAARIGAWNPDAPVLVVDDAPDDPGLAAWQGWLSERIRRHRR